MYTLSENVKKLKPYVAGEGNAMEQFSLHTLKRGSLRKQHFQQSNNNDNTAEFIYNPTQQKCNNISIKLPFEICSNEKNSLDSTSSLANKNLFLQTPVLNLKFDKSLQEISIISKTDMMGSPNRNINNNLQSVDTTPLVITTTPNIDSKKHKAPTTPHRIVCEREVRYLEEGNFPDELGTKTYENDIIKVCF